MSYTLENLSSVEFRKLEKTCCPRRATNSVRIDYTNRETVLSRISSIATLPVSFLRIRIRPAFSIKNLASQMNISFSRFLNIIRIEYENPIFNPS